MARTWIIAGTAWAGIVALGWWLADQRALSTCHDHFRGIGCDIGALTTRDNVLIWGGSIPLALFVLLAIAGRVRIERLNMRWPKRDRTPPSTSREVVVHERGEGST